MSPTARESSSERIWIAHILAALYDTVRPPDPMKPTIAALLLSIALLQAGCLTTVTRATLMQKATRHSLTPLPDTTFYCGSQRAFDYFYIQPAGPSTLRRPLWLRVPERENTVSDRFEYTTQRSRWRVLVGLDRRAQGFWPSQAPMQPAVTPRECARGTLADLAVGRQSWACQEKGTR